MRQRRKKLVDYKAELAQREATGADSPEGLKCAITITDQAVTIEWDPFLPDGPHEVTKDRAPGRRHRVRHEPGKDKRTTLRVLEEP